MAMCGRATNSALLRDWTATGDTVYTQSKGRGRRLAEARPASQNTFLPYLEWSRIRTKPNLIEN